MKEKSMGISFAIAASDAIKSNNKEKPIFQLTVILLLNALGLSLALSSAFRLPFHMGAVVGLTVLYALMFNAIYQCRWGVIGAAVVFGLIALFFRNDLRIGFLQTASWIGEAVLEHNTVSWNMHKSDTYAIMPMTMFFAAALFPLIFLLSYAVLNRVNVFLLLLIIVPILETALFFGLPPSVFSFVMLAIGCFSLFALNQSAPRFRKRCLDARGNAQLKKQAGNMSLVVSAVVGIIIMLAWLLLSEINYAQFTRSFQPRKDAGQMLKSALSFTYVEKTPPQGGITGGRFVETDQFSFSGDTALAVEADAFKGSIYLKGFVGGNYNQNGWKPLYEEQLKNEDNILPSEVIGYDSAMLSTLFHAQQKLLKITKKEAAVKDYFYYPYFLRENLVSKRNQDSYLAPYYDVINEDNNLFLYNREMIQNQLQKNLGLAEGTVIVGQLDDYFEKEKRQAEYIHRTYTQLPNPLSERLSEEFSPLRNEYSSIESLIKTVTGSLSSRAAYTLTPGNTPADKDYVDYFLYENRKGYCTHFASAATVIFRLCNVPARYVEGYVITNEDYTRAKQTDDGRVVMNIRDTNAHAWCEIYLDGFGWVPVEVTPGLVSINTDGTAPSDGEKIEYETEDESTMNDIPMEIPQVENIQAQTSSDAPAGQKRGQISMNLSYWFIALTVVLLLAVFILLRRRAVKRQIIELNQNNHSVACLSWYRYFLNGLRIAFPEKAIHNEISLIQWVRELEDTEVILKDTLTCAMPVIQKAAYSPNVIDAFEYSSALQLLKKAISQLYDNMSVAKKIRWRYFHMLPVDSEIKTKGEPQ